MTKTAILSASAMLLLTACGNDSGGAVAPAPDSSALDQVAGAAADSLPTAITPDLSNELDQVFGGPDQPPLAVGDDDGIADILRRARQGG